MTCIEFARRDIHALMPNCTVAQAADLMDLSQQTLVPICQAGGEPLGVVSARDIVLRVLAKRRLPALTSVQEVMSTPPLFVFGDAPIELACTIMSDDGVGQLLVLSPSGRLDGILSLADVALELSDPLLLAAARRVLGKRHAARRPGTTMPVDRAGEPDPGIHTTNAARDEADMVVRGGTNGFKEFP